MPTRILRCLAGAVGLNRREIGLCSPHAERGQSLDRAMAKPLQHRQVTQLADEENNFAWIGSVERGKAHHRRVHAPSFLVEHDNVRNSANHSHKVWRDYDGDFVRDITGEHRRAHAQ